MKVLYQQSISFVILTLNKELFNHLITAAVADKKHFVVIKSKEGFLLYHNRSLLRLSAIADCLFFPQTLLQKSQNWTCGFHCTVCVEDRASNKGSRRFQNNFRTAPTIIQFFFFAFLDF